MKIAVVDDNESERTKLCTLLREWGEKRKYEMVCNEFTDGEDFLKASGTYQAVFLDIYMEKLNGIDTARMLRKYDKNCKIIFMTISEDHRAEAFEVHAYDYLEKPVTALQIERVLADLSEVQTEDQSYLVLSAGRSQVPVILSELRFVVSDANYCVIQTDQKQRVRIVFSELERMLSCERRFLKINRGILVNLDFVSSMENRICMMRNGEQFPMNSRRADILRQELVYYRFEKRNRQLSRKAETGKIQEHFVKKETGRVQTTEISSERPAQCLPGKRI